MNWLLSLIAAIFVFLTAFSFLIVLASYIGVYLIKPRWPEWWENHICAPDPEEAESIYSTYSQSIPVEALG